MRKRPWRKRWIRKKDICGKKGVGNVLKMIQKVLSDGRKAQQGLRKGLIGKIAKKGGRQRVK
jgi:hypothetical protein